MGNVVVKEAYLDLLKQGLNMDHLTQFAKNNEEKLDNETRHRMITEELTNLYLKKNHDYGNSFDISLDDDGLLVAKIRLGDKYQRFGSLLKKKQEVEDESRRDTLIDMANYAIMTVMWMDAQEKLQRTAPPGADTDGDYIHIPSDVDSIMWYKSNFSEVAAGADLDGDTGQLFTDRKFTDEELERLAGLRELTTNEYVKCNIDDILAAKKAGLK